MAFPTILVNSATGSDAQASGAGPSTALFGTTDASTDGAGTVVTLTAGTDLTNVATDGSHVIFLNDTTASARNFGKITAKAGSGGATPTVTVSDAFGAGLTTKSWAIGGKRASIGSTTSKKLFDNNSGNGDAMPGWIVECESGHAETIAALYGLRRAGDPAGDGPVVLRGTPGAGTMPAITFSNNGVAFNLLADYQKLYGFDIRNSNGTKTASVGVSVTNGVDGCYVADCKINNANNFWKGILVSGNGDAIVANNNIAGTASNGIETASTATAEIIGNEVSTAGGIGISWGGSAGVAIICHNIIKGCTGDGINLSTDMNAYIASNTIDDCDGDGIELSAALTTSHQLLINNIVSNNGGYGINYSGSSAERYHAGPRIAWNNNTYNNTSGAYNPSGIGVADPGVDPQFAGSGVYTIGTNLQAQGWPESNVGMGLTRSYVDIGAAQRQEPAGSSGPRFGIHGNGPSFSGVSA